MIPRSALFQEEKITNVYISPSHSSPFKWFGVIFVHQHPYHGAILRFTIHIPHNFPSPEIPKVIFEQKPFHPLIDQKTGLLCTSIEFPEWNPSVTPIWKLISYIKSIFKDVEKQIESLKQILDSGSSFGSSFSSTSSVPTATVEEKKSKSEDQNSLLGEETNSSASKSEEQMIRTGINTEAIKMFTQDKSCFQFKVAEVVVKSRANVYEPPNDANDQNAIIFGPFIPEIHEEIRQNQLLAGRPTRIYEDSLPAILYIKGNEVTIN